MNPVLNALHYARSSSLGGHVNSASGPPTFAFYGFSMSAGYGMGAID